jgi:SAM-dependent methyltransferase
MQISAFSTKCLSEIAQHPWLAKWLLADDHERRGTRREMNFKSYEGPEHLRRFLTWNLHFRGRSYLPTEMIESLAQTSARRDAQCCDRLGIAIDSSTLLTVGRENAEDYLFQRVYPMPERFQIRRLLDFGGGFGRMANLSFAAPGTRIESIIAVEGIPSTYLTQRLYFRGMGFDCADYLDESAAGRNFNVTGSLGSCQIIHLPTWQMRLIPDESVDAICCIQVLRELYPDLLIYVVKQFSRILRPGGQLYIRDHIQFHDPNQMPQQLVLQTHGFVLEFWPQIRDRADLHGIPRIWRRFDPAVYASRS